MTGAQKAFAKAVEKEQKKWRELFGEGNTSLIYHFHDDETVSVDGALWSILNYGEADYGYGRRLYQDIQEALEAEGYYLENINMTDFVFVEVTSSPR